MLNKKTGKLKFLVIKKIQNIHFVDTKFAQFYMTITFSINIYIYIYIYVHFI